MRLFSPERRVRKPVAVTTAVAALALTSCAEGKPQPQPLPTCSRTEMGNEVRLSDDGSAKLTEIIRAPSAHPHSTKIEWEGATLAVRRYWRRGEPIDSVVVQSPVENGGGGFALGDDDNNGILEVMTVALEPTELPAPLSAEIQQKLVQSLAEVCLMPPSPAAI